MSSTKTNRPLMLPNDDDFGTFISEVERCKKTGEPFYMCPRNKLEKELLMEHDRGFFKGLLIGGLTVFGIFFLIKTIRG